MIKILEIDNFKSIKHLKLECKKINIFIGKPNTGKSNILETLGILSFGQYVNYTELKDFVRFENMSNLFYDEDLERNIKIKPDNEILQINFVFDREIFYCKTPFSSLECDYEGKKINILHYTTNFKKLHFKFYRFAIKERFLRREFDFLLPPSGDNLLALLIARKELRKFVKDIFEEYGLRIVLKPQENKIEVQKEIEDIIISYPYSLVSDTLQRVVFHLLAIETNKNSIIVFEEPEAHAFPYYTKFLAERIALDKSNQYFISTHNPYLLLSILEKAPKDDVRIFITYFEDYQTKVKNLSEEDIKEIMDMEIDIFFNIGRFL
ncbi:MAG: AAA family ATPase [Candidatus Desulfofervidus auxilii]|nr:AAA family ATPase [Candidatus Desulfofervidus auxilii]